MCRPIRRLAPSTYLRRYDVVAATRAQLTAGHPERPVMAYVGRWSAEKRMHLLKSCRPEGTTLCFVGDGPMREVVCQWHDPPRVVGALCKL